MDLLTTALLLPLSTRCCLLVPRLCHPGVLKRRDLRKHQTYDI